MGTFRGRHLAMTQHAMTLLIFLALLGLLDPAPAASAATYYVDFSSGNDSNSGTTPAAAWKYCPGMASYAGSGVLRPGDVVYFDSADTWPVVGSQGLYLLGGVTYLGDSWGAGTRATIRADADLDAGVVRFRDHPIFETVLKGFEINANGKVATGIDINHRFATLMTGAVKRVQNSVVHHIWSRVALGQYKYGIIVSNHAGQNGYVENVEIIDTLVRDVSRDGIVLYPGDEFSDSRIKNITVRGSEVYNTGQDPDYCCGAGIAVKGYVKDAFIEFNYVHNVKGASIFVNGNETHHYPGFGPSNIHIRHNLFVNATGSGAIRVYDGASGGDPKDLKIYGNLVYNTTIVNPGFLIASDLKNTLNLLMYNNTFFNAPVVVQQNNASVNTFAFRNNIVHYSSGVPLTDVAGVISSHSNNLYFRNSGTLVASNGNNYTSGTLSSYEPSASHLDPMFLNIQSFPTGFAGTYPQNKAPNTDGFSLRSNSPARGYGTPLDTAYSTSINSITRSPSSHWDSGAYESPHSASNQPPNPPTNLTLF